MSGQFPCPHCGNPINEGYRLCASCGAYEVTELHFVVNTLIKAALALIGISIFLLIAALVSKEFSAFFALPVAILGVLLFLRLEKYRERFPDSVYWKRKQ